MVYSAKIYSPEVHIISVRGHCYRLAIDLRRAFVILSAKKLHLIHLKMNATNNTHSTIKPCIQNFWVGS